MSTQIDLRKLERKAFRATFQDGLTDVQLGAVFVMLSLVPLFESWGLQRPFGYFAVFGLLFLLWIVIKMVKIQIVQPRLGTAVFSPQRNNRTKQARLALAIMLLATIALVALTAAGVMQNLFGAFNAWSGYLFIGAIFVVTLSLLAFFLDYPRLYAYGWFLAFMDPFSVWMEMKSGWLFPNGATVFGSVIVLIGIATFVRFLHRHPRPQQTGI
ncbi:MAG: hypothetical protein GY796_03435 [Chloroflexi bacterium]|nr:hypothetical protein [Chloroflexota bacterium]